jgi:hypothetical protein
MALILGGAEFLAGLGDNSAGTRVRDAFELFLLVVEHLIDGELEVFLLVVFKGHQ